MTDNTLQEQIRAVLRQQAEAIRVAPPDPRSVLTTRALPPAGNGANPRRNRFVLLGVIALVAAVVGGTAILWASPGTVTVGPATSSPPIPELDRQFDFDTQVGARLQAVEFLVDTGGLTFSPIGDTVEVLGDPGNPATDHEQGYTSLELTWFENDVEMRVYLYFASDGTDWWIDEIRTYDGAEPGDWISMPGEFVRTPLGQSFVGDLDAGPLHVGGMVLEGFVPRLSSCDGSGPPGQLLLELSGARPVTGPFLSGDRAGYATTVAVLDASTCEPFEPEGLDFRAATADLEVAAVDDEGLTFDPSWAPGEIYVGVRFTGVGETLLTVTAVDRRTGDVVASVDLPVTVTEES